MCNTVVLSAVPFSWRKFLYIVLLIIRNCNINSKCLFSFQYSYILYRDEAKIHKIAYNILASVNSPDNLAYSDCEVEPQKVNDQMYM